MNYHIFWMIPKNSTTYPVYTTHIYKILITFKYLIILPRTVISSITVNLTKIYNKRVKQIPKTFKRSKPYMSINMYLYLFLISLRSSAYFSVLKLA